MFIKSVTGAILAGGKSSRMGRDKALLEIDGKPFIQRIAETLRQIFDHVVIISGHGENYKFLNLPIYNDVYRNCGPLGGVHSALTHSTTKSVFIVPCDLPFLSPDVVRSILSSHAWTAATVPTAFGCIQPLCGVYTRRCLPLLEEHLKRGQFKVHRFLESAAAAFVTLPHRTDLEISSLIANINSVEEFKRWVKDAPIA